MTRRTIALGGALFLAFAALPLQAQDKGGTIRVQINYTGTGTVDQDHKIYVALWDSPDFAKPGTQMMPVAVKFVASKNGIVSFTDVKKTPAYVSAAYDPTGKWDGQSGPPPTGSPIGMASDAPPTPKAIDAGPGKSAKATIKFDDSQKMM